MLISDDISQKNEPQNHILYLNVTGFTDRRAKHGGRQRTEQIEELMEVLDATFVKPKSTATVLRMIARQPISALTMAQYLLAQILFHGLTLKPAVAVLRHGFDAFLEIKRDTSALIVLETRNNWTIPFGLLATKISRNVVLLPQNIEFLVADQDSGAYRNKSKHFNAETRMFRLSAQIFTISDIDRYILRIQGNEVEVLPYFPSTIKFVELSEILAGRAIKDRTSGIRRLVFLGTSKNPPTKRALTQLLAELADVETDFNLAVIGGGTEIFRHKFSDDRRFTFHGEVDDQELKQHLVDAELAVVPMVPTTGALTRLTDLSLAGVPAALFGNQDDIRTRYQGKYPLFETNQIGVKNDIAIERFSISLLTSLRPELVLNRTGRFKVVTS